MSQILKVPSGIMCSVTVVKPGDACKAAEMDQDTDIPRISLVTKHLYFSVKYGDFYKL